MRPVLSILVCMVVCSIGTMAHSSSVTRDTISGSAVRFDGTLDSIRISNSASFNIGTTMTLTMWYKPEGIPDHNSFLFNKWTSGSEDKQFSINPSTEKIHAGFYPMNSVPAPFVPSLDTWYHLVIRYDGSYVQIYIDGQLVVSHIRNFNVNDSYGDVFIGHNISRSYEQGDTSLFGVVDEMRLYTRALDPTEVLQDYNDGVAGIQSTVSTANLTAEWHFDEGAGTTVADTSGYGNDYGTFGSGVSAPTWVLEGATAVPEPMSCGLILSGLIGLFARLFFRRNR